MLPEPHWVALQLVLAERQPIYLVGGIVRDLFLGRANFDLDFVSLAPAWELARRLRPVFEQHFGPDKVKLLEHSAFGTARLDAGEALHLDFATARHETYAHPAALPTVAFPASLEQDLRRRDFTINALALSPDGGLYDPFDGLRDLREGWLRVLHPLSFVDDPTRMVRGLRFAARFGYHFEPITLQLFEEALAGGYFGLLSAERKRNELRLVLKEAHRAKGLALLQQSGLLSALHPLLGWDEKLETAFASLEAYFSGKLQPYEYLATLLHDLGEAHAKVVVNQLRFAGPEFEVPIEVARLWEVARPRLNAELKNSQLYDLLHEYKADALPIFEALLTESSQRETVRRYREEISKIKPVLNGDYLLKLGVSPGPRIRILLTELRTAVLDGELVGREQEEAFLRQRLAEA